jgi:hypothetical protein
MVVRFVPFEKRYPPEWLHDPDAAEPKMELELVPLAETWAGGLRWRCRRAA